MDFARKQLEKYGWTAGKGLGKNENGISEALKPKLKRSMTGLGHDLASDFTEHWWNDLYNKAAQNVEVEEVNGKVKKFKSKEATFEITNNTWHIKKKKKGDSPNEQYTDHFVRTAILCNGASKIEKINKSESEDEGFSMDIVKISDNDLFAACEGRTAHKGARHGLKALGKLARIEQQEKMLMNEEKYNGYYNKNKENSKIDLECIDLQEKTKSLCNIDQVASKKKKKKYSCMETGSVDIATVCIDEANSNSEDRKPESYNKKKEKRKKRNDLQNESDISKVIESDVPKKKKKTSNSCETNTLNIQENNVNETQGLKKKKKDKREDSILSVEKNTSKREKSFQAECTSETNEDNITNIQKDSDYALNKKRKKKKKYCKNI